MASDTLLIPIFERFQEHERRVGVFDEVSKCFSRKVVPLFPVGRWFWGTPYGMNTDEVIVIDTLVVGHGHHRREHHSVDA